jgi:hypothetical protein
MADFADPGGTSDLGLARDKPLYPAAAVPLILLFSMIID